MTGRIDRLTEDDVPAGPLLSARDLARINAAETARDWAEPDHDRIANNYEKGLGW